MKSFKVTVSSLTPYMQHKMNDSALKKSEVKRAKTVGRSEVEDEDDDRAESFCYRDRETGRCYIPSEHIKGALINAAKNLKGKVGTRSVSLKTTVAGSFFVRPLKIEIPNWDEADSRSAVNAKVKARVIVIRPKWNEWSATFTLLVDEDGITTSTVKELITIAGSSVGIGSFRPSNSGEYGRFKLDAIEEI